MKSTTKARVTAIVTPVILGVLLALGGAAPSHAASAPRIPNYYKVSMVACNPSPFVGTETWQAVGADYRAVGPVTFRVFVDGHEAGQPVTVSSQHYGWKNYLAVMKFPIDKNFHRVIIMENEKRVAALWASDRYCHGGTVIPAPVQPVPNNHPSPFYPAQH